MLGGRGRARELGYAVHDSKLRPAGEGTVADGGVPPDSSRSPVSHRILKNVARELLLPGNAFAVLVRDSVHLHRQPVVELGVWVAGPAAGGILADWDAEAERTRDRAPVQP